MRLFSAFAAVIVLSCAAAATGRADKVSAGVGASRTIFTAASDGPDTIISGKLVARHPHVRGHARYIRRWHQPRPAAVFAANYYYNPLLPGTLDIAYDRAMVLHFRSPPVTDTFLAEPGFPATPPVRGLFPYRVRAWAGLYEYDGLIGQYVRLAPSDVSRVAASAPLLP